MQINPTFLEVVLLLISSCSIYIWVEYGKKILRWWKDLRRKRLAAGPLKPRSPEACPKCASGYHHLPRRPRRDVVPWKEIKGTAGRKKRIDTTGYACMNPRCKYRWVTDPDVHALVSDGYRGVRKDILYLRCQACGKKQTSRLDTPMKDLRTPVGGKKSILKHFCRSGSPTIVMMQATQHRITDYPMVTSSDSVDILFRWNRDHLVKPLMGTAAGNTG